MQCPNCGFEYSEDMRFCGQCGQPLLLGEPQLRESPPPAIHLPSWLFAILILLLLDIFGVPLVNSALGNGFSFSGLAYLLMLEGFILIGAAVAGITHRGERTPVIIRGKVWIQKPDDYRTAKSEAGGLIMAAIGFMFFILGMITAG